LAELNESILEKLTHITGLPAEFIKNSDDMTVEKAMGRIDFVPEPGERFGHYYRILTPEERRRIEERLRQYNG